MNIPYREDSKFSSFFNCSKTFVAILIAVMLSVPSLVWAQDSTAAAGAAPAAGGGDAAKGETLFKNNCAQCHAVTDERVVGPGLKGASARHDFAWLSKWVKNSQAVIASGDPVAVKLYNDYAKAQMTSFPNLSDDDIKGIFAYVDKAGTAAPATAAAAGGGAATSAPTQSSGPSDLFMIVVVALVVVMLLVLAVLLVIVSLLSKAVSGTTEEVPKVDFMTTLGNKLKGIAMDPSIRSATIWIFVLLVLKATLDGAYGVGIQQGYAPKQPISFSHKLHAGEYKIDCNYCHTGVNRGKSAHIPSANICMNCHGVIKKESPEIQKIYTSIENNQPIEWVRVHNLPDFAYFNHAQHVNVGGVECESCHGEIGKMEVIQQRSSLTMGWCIDCHRKTEVNTKDNKYYDKLVQLHGTESKEALKVADIGGLECSKCHY